MHIPPTTQFPPPQACLWKPCPPAVTPYWAPRFSLTGIGRGRYTQKGKNSDGQHSGAGMGRKEKVEICPLPQDFIYPGILDPS